MGDKAFQILHLPGHSPGSIGLFDVKRKVLFSGDALYDGELLDSLYHSDKTIYANTLERLVALDVELIHAGHFPSFGKARMNQLIEQYRRGDNSLVDVEKWFSKQQHRDMFADQDWGSFLSSH